MFQDDLTQYKGSKGYSATSDEDVAKVMMLPDISHVYRQTAKLISTEKDKAKNFLHMHKIWSIGNCA